MADVETLTQEDLVAIVTIALRNPIRSTVEQDALVRVCQQIDNAFVQWSADAGETWEGTRCSCGRSIPIWLDNCAACSSSTWRVTCEDGVVRHDPFTTRAEANRWVEWGHACTTSHTIEEVRP